MTLSTQKVESNLELQFLTNIDEIRGVLNNLLYVPDVILRPLIICNLNMYIEQKLYDQNYSLKFFMVRKDGNLPLGFVVCQMDPDYKSYGMKCASFGWLHASDFESCKLLMEACEQYTREQGFKKLRGPINYPKYIGGVGYQVMGHNAPLMNGVAFNSPQMKEVEFLKRLSYEPESEYSCVNVVQKTWDKGDNLDHGIVIKFLPPDEIRALKPKLMELAKNSFYSVLADAPGGSCRLDEMFDSYDSMIQYLKANQEPLDIDPETYFKVPRFIEFFKASDPINAVPCCPIAFDIETGEIAGTIMAVPNLYQIWKEVPLTEINVDTAMIKKEYAGKGIFSAMNNIGQLMCRYRGAEYFEGTTIWSNNDRAVKTIFPHSTPLRKHIVFQKRLLRK